MSRVSIPACLIVTLTLTLDTVNLAAGCMPWMFRDDFSFTFSILLVLWVLWRTWRFQNLGVSDFLAHLGVAHASVKKFIYQFLVECSAV